MATARTDPSVIYHVGINPISSIKRLIGNFTTEINSKLMIHFQCKSTRSFFYYQNVNANMLHIKYGMQQRMQP